MQMEMIENNEATALETTVARLAAAASLLEQAMERLTERQQNAEVTIGRISATVEAALEERLAAAETRLAAADQKIAELMAASASYAPSTVTNTRKTLPASMATMLAKQGVTVASVEAGALDTALTSLSLEQRIAVKAQLLRSGLLS
jgi:predicted  nucleic acid-binding Zn-ribbon protein